ncbi:Arm DNA-binding domain-containing protein [Mucilaginibacter sp. P25]|nr:Arm DNA-binding domain-containing protein [Mucilaginibacter gossypii]
MKRTKALPNGNAPIYLWITVDSERVEIATKRNAPPDKRITAAQKVMGNTDDARSVNSHLKTIEQKAYEVYREMIERKIPITAQTFKDRMMALKRKYNKITEQIIAV